MSNVSKTEIEQKRKQRARYFYRLRQRKKKERKKQERNRIPLLLKEYFPTVVVDIIDVYCKPFYCEDCLVHFMFIRPTLLWVKDIAYPCNTCHPDCTECKGDRIATELVGYTSRKLPGTELGVLHASGCPTVSLESSKQWEFLVHSEDGYTLSTGEVVNGNNIWGSF